MLHMATSLCVAAVFFLSLIGELYCEEKMRTLKLGFYYENSHALSHHELLVDLIKQWNFDHIEDDAVIEMEYKFEPISNPYTSMLSSVALVERGCHMILAVVNCPSAIAIRSWSSQYKVPTFIVPLDLCVQIQKPTTTDNNVLITMQTSINHFHQPAFDLATFQNWERIVIVLDDRNYQRLYVDTNAITNSFVNSSVFVYKMEEMVSFFDEDAVTAGHDNFVVIGDGRSCNRFFSYGRHQSPVLKIRFNWIVSCRDLSWESLKIPNSTMATMYLVSAVDWPESAEMPAKTAALQRKRRDQHLQESVDMVLDTLFNMTRTIVDAFGSSEIVPPTAPTGIVTLSQADPVWEDGHLLIEATNRHLDDDQHEEHQHRNRFTIHAFDIEFKTWTQIGSWERRKGLSPSVSKHKKTRQLTAGISRRHIKVVTVVEPPFVSAELTAHGVHYYGYCIDLLDEIVQELNLTYSIYNASVYGSLIDNHWTGAVGEVVYRRADMAVSGMIITSARQDVVDFSSRYMDYSVGILIKKPLQSDDGFGFLNPLRTKVWGSFLVLIFAVALLMYVLTRISPSAERVNELSGFTDISKFNLRNSIWFMISSIMMQGVDIQPATPSGRIIGTFWWFFSLTVTAMYTANLAAFLTVNRMETPIDSLQSLAYQNKIAYGTVVNSPIHLDFMEQAEMIPLYERIYSALTADKKDGEENLAPTADEGFKRVRTGTYAFMWDDAILQWMQTIHCEYMTVGKPFMNKGYGIAMNKGSPLKKDLSSTILHLQEKGILEKLRQQWFLNATECITGTRHEEETEDADSSAKGIDIKSVKGIFLTLIGGVLMSVVAVACEIWISKTFGFPRRLRALSETAGIPSCDLNDNQPSNFSTADEISEDGIYGWRKTAQYGEVESPTRIQARIRSNTVPAPAFIPGITLPLPSHVVSYDGYKNGVSNHSLCSLRDLERDREQYTRMTQNQLYSLITPRPLRYLTRQTTIQSPPETPLALNKSSSIQNSSNEKFIFYDR